MSQVDDNVLVSLERQYASGLTSSDLIDVCGAHGIQLSEATLRKYVQLGLLPRSVRVGRKGKHKGSLGMYPVRAIRQLVRIKEMMAENYTIEEIRRDFLFVRTDIEQLEQTLACIFQTLSRAARGRRPGTTDPVAREVSRARRQGQELVTHLSSIEALLIRRSRLSRSGSVGTSLGQGQAEASRAAAS